MSQASFIITGSGKISAVIDGKAFTVDTDHANYAKLIEAVKEKNWTEFVKLVDVAQGLKNYLVGGVEISDGSITYQGQVIHNSLTTRILDFMRNDLPFEPMVKFLGNLLQNPSYRAVNELYDFLEVGELPITEDGCFLAFKNVRADFKDIYSGTMDNSVGQVLSMPRNMVDEDKNRTCSGGLHFCSIKYLPNFVDSDGGHTMIVKINPADVVAIPADYNNTKGRTCKYEVVAEYTGDWRKRVQDEKDSGFDAPLYSSEGGEYEADDEGYDEGYDDSDYDDDDDAEDVACDCPLCQLSEEEPVYGVKPSGQKFYNKRDSKGHFIKS